ncbi:DNA polymerase III subunit delta [Pseudoprimorskyibacter insulae]|uniref:DNA-directed DNA polymerase n=1 Tax=Pseudoprimorskyibacter insulae TaxID=1695997 RepID=A0A2R8AV79_9RHOB|nr:DNA polymerase III subunit delta [Pseudoprimorskyibacter insulae]SPF79804.1 hypothetical protein PRI8871_01602 [Pseudoprimorskyibacter insulae]
MKLSGRDAPAYFAKPDPDKLGLLIFGADAMRVALKRQEVIAALTGPGADEEMRITRMNGGELRKDPAMLLDAIKAQGFFPGPRVAFVEEATDGLAKIIGAAVDEWRPGDAQIIVTAGQLTAKSALRKVFEGHKMAYAAGLYDDPPSRAEIEADFKRSGLTDIGQDAMGKLTALSRQLDPGDFRQTVEKIALYKLNDPSPLTADEVDLMSPTSTEADVDDVLNIIAEGRVAEFGQTMQRLKSQGVTPVTLIIMATRHFRSLHAIASDPGGPAQGIGRVRPPIFGPRRDKMLRQAQMLGMYLLEDVLKRLTSTDLQLRSAGQTAPQMAVVERALMWIASKAERRR